jgi:hypothetical protein
LSAMEIEAERLPVAVGLKATAIAQLPPAATLEPQVLLCEKSPAAAPAMLMPVTVSAAVPVFESVRLCVALVVPTSCPPNVRLEVERLTIGAGPELAPQLAGALGGGTPLPPPSS